MDVRRYGPASSRKGGTASSPRCHRPAGAAAKPGGPPSGGHAAHPFPGGAAAAGTTTGPAAGTTTQSERTAAPRPKGSAPARTAGAAAARQAALLACWIAAGMIATWPRALCLLAGRLPAPAGPASRDPAAYVWDMWWVAHQVTRLGNPWHTGHMAAPVGAQLGYHTLMPLPGLLMTPVTLTFGASVSANLLSAAAPGLLCYAAYRAARLCLPAWPGRAAAAALFGLSPEMCWASWYQLNLALGALFLPLTLAAALRLRRGGGARQAAVLGLVTGAALLTDQESAVLAAMLAAAALATWLAPWRGRARECGSAAPHGMAAAEGSAVTRDTAATPGPAARLGLAALAAGVALAVASPQLISMAVQTLSGGADIPPAIEVTFYNNSGIGLAQMFAPSPRLDAFGLHALTRLYHEGRQLQPVIGYGLTLTLLAVAGAALASRSRGGRSLALLWLGSSVLALGTAPLLVKREYRPLAQRWYGVPISQVMPYSWLVHLPGMGGFREAARFTELGLLAAALLAGVAVNWLSIRARPALALVLAAALLETGWSGGMAVPGVRAGTIPAALPALDGPIAADHSPSVVVDVPFGLRGGLPITGGAFPPQTLVLATEDGHPLADALISRIPPQTLAGIRRYAFYKALLNAQGGPRQNSPSLLRQAWHSARRIDVGWVVAWQRRPAVLRVLRAAGFRLSYRADGAWVYRRTAACPLGRCWQHRHPGTPAGPARGGHRGAG
jgi:hypothetical protein